MSEAPKLFTNKPKKTKLKQNLEVSATSTMASSSSTGMGTAPPPPPPRAPTPPPPVKESFARRYKFLWPLLLAVNFSVGAYLFMRTKKKDVDTEETELPNVPPTPTSTSTTAAAPIAETPVSPPIINPVPRAPILEDQQRELFKWILEEKRKVTPKDAEERKRIDEEKAILKQFIRAKAVPSL